MLTGTEWLPREGRFFSARRRRVPEDGPPEKYTPPTQKDRPERRPLHSRYRLKDPWLTVVREIRTIPNCSLRLVSGKLLLDGKPVSFALPHVMRSKAELCPAKSENGFMRHMQEVLGPRVVPGWFAELFQARPDYLPRSERTGPVGAPRFIFLWGTIYHHKQLGEGVRYIRYRDQMSGGVVEIGFRPLTGVWRRDCLVMLTA